MTTEMTKNQANGESRRFYARPDVDVFESDAELLLVADLPGVAKEGLDVRFHDGELVVEAARKPREPRAGIALDQQVTDFRRAFALPDGIDAEKIEAELANGVLTVRLPKSAAKRARKIDVRSA